MNVGDEPPRALLKRRRGALSGIWIVPLLATLVAGYVVYDRVRELGPAITIKFKDVSGVKPGQTQIKYRGVPVGEVVEVALSDDRRHALVRARLQRATATLARSGSQFWIVRPEVGIGTITGLGTVISGPEIGVAPGSGESAREFIGQDSMPLAAEYRGLDIVLRAPRLGALRANSPVYYRGIEVGIVRGSDLDGKARAVAIHVTIQQRYAGLVRRGSRFWEVSGLEAHFGLFRGLTINVESLRALLAGGIAFASPPGSPPARAGAEFDLHDGPRPAWLGWSPALAVGALE